MTAALRAVSLVAALALLLGCARAGAANTRPIIAVLTQPTSPELIAYGPSFLAASYAKWLESAGARVSPLLHTMGAEEMRAFLSKVNGVLLPGGGILWDHHPEYVAALRTVFAAAKQFNDAGDYFPLWGTCLGFEELIMLAADDPWGDALDCGMDSRNLALKVGFTNASSSSRLWSGVPSFVVDDYATQPIAYHAHSCGVSVDRFRNHSRLSRFYKSLSEDQDRQGHRFVSSVEAYDYPFYAIMWHPEKTDFEWNSRDAVPRSKESSEAAYYVSRFLISEASKSNHKFASDDEEFEALVYRTPAVYTAKVKKGYQQCYFPGYTPVCTGEDKLVDSVWATDSAVRWEHRTPDALCGIRNRIGAIPFLKCTWTFKMATKVDFTIVDMYQTSCLLPLLGKTVNLKLFYKPGTIQLAGGIGLADDGTTLSDNNALEVR
eukprot:m51a1_g3878 putative peptidase c26 family protein (434) ;mRNA; r:30437-32299